MKVLPARTPALAKHLYPRRVWSMPQNTHTVYLTFDDGPIPGPTPWVLDQLREAGAKATFFCIGDNAARHPEILNRIIAEGHALGNHTYNHLDGWKTRSVHYLENVKRVEDVFESRLFRPPYGKLRQKQARKLAQRGYTIVMWDVLSYDWDSSVSQTACLQNLLKNLRPGSIVVFHDSLKAERNLRATLPGVLSYINKQNWKMEALDL